MYRHRTPYISVGTGYAKSTINEHEKFRAEQSKESMIEGSGLRASGLLRWAVSLVYSIAEIHYTGGPTLFTDNMSA